MERFTREDRAELEQLAESRDQNRSRGSRFSVGEQGELDETADLLRVESEHRARNLDFNEVQRKQLVHMFRRRLLPILAYLVLAGMVAYSFSVERNHSNANRAAVAHSAQSVSRANCLRTNDVQDKLKALIRQEVPSTIASDKFFVKQHVLTQAQANYTLVQLEATVKQQVSSLPDINCYKLAVVH